MHPGVDLHFDFGESQNPVINRTWIGQLVDASNSNTGLHLIPEPEDLPSTPKTAHAVR